MDLFNELQSKILILNNKIKELKSYGLDRASAEQNYKIALAQFLAQEIANGKKVTVLSDLARGQKDIAQLRFYRDSKQIIYDATLESIFALKTEIRILETQLKLEYGNSR